MPDLGSLMLPALYVLTAGLVVAVAVTGNGTLLLYVRGIPLAVFGIAGIAALGWAVGAYQLLVLLHIIGAFIFLMAHGVSVFVAWRLPSETNGERAAALLDLSRDSIDWIHAGLWLLVTSGVAAGFVGQWWDRLWIWLALDLLLAITALMYKTAPAAYRDVGTRLEEVGPPAWDADAQALVDRRRATLLMATGTSALLAIVALMVLKPG